MDTIRSLFRHLRQTVARWRALVSGDDLSDAQGHRSDGDEHRSYHGPRITGSL